MAVGGNINAVVEVKTTAQNDLGEDVESWEAKAMLKGWLDMQSGDSTLTHNAKLSESTHIFLCDTFPTNVTEENSRLSVGDQVYSIQYIDNPMELSDHFEIYLKRIGRQ